MSFIETLSDGEGKTVEFKVEMPSSDNLTKTLIAFANTAGGRLIIGVADDGTVKGLPDADPTSYIDKVANILHDAVSPIIVPDIYTLAVDDKTIVVVEVYPSASRPHYLKTKGRSEGTYIRVGATNRLADADIIVELERQKRNIAFDEDLCLDQLTASQENELLTILSKNIERSLELSDLVNLKVLSRNGAELRPTNAALLILGIPEHCQIRCARFKGDSMGIFLDQKDIRGDLFTQVKAAMTFLLTHIELRGEIGPDNLRRIDTYEISPEALREAVINAIVHRDYSIYGSDIKIAIYDSFIEITSPGDLPRGITIDEAVSGRSEIRNRILARVFKEASPIEQWGRGFKLMFDLCRSAGLSAPQVIESGRFVTVRFFRRAHSELLSGQKSGQKTYGRSENTHRAQDIEKAIIDIVADRPTVSRRSIAGLLGISPSAVQRRIDVLVKTGVLKRVGPDKGGYWDILLGKKA